MKISVIIPTYNRSDALALTLERLSKQQFNGQWEVIVVNNNSADDTNEVVTERQRKFPVPMHLVQEEKPGAAAARNAGARIAAGEYLVFIDNDILTTPDFLHRHLQTLETNRNSWIVGAVANLPEQEDSAFGKFRKSLFPVDAAEKPYEIIAFTGANSSLPRSDFEKLGGFDENFESGEDQELAMRARNELGVKILRFPNIIVLHNDWAGWTFPDFCRRQRIYARTEFHFWQKYGDQHPRQDLVKENLPADWKKDSYKLLFRKQIKKVLSREISQKVLLGITKILESSLPTRIVLWRIYKLALAGAIHKGFDEGRTRVLRNKIR